MYVLMLVRHWEELSLRKDDGTPLGITGMCTPIPGGGNIPVTAFLPVFSTFEHAEAARGDKPNVAIHEIAPMSELEKEDPSDDDDFYGKDWKP
jgi:hypothetical protein